MMQVDMYRVNFHQATKVREKPAFQKGFSIWALKILLRQLPLTVFERRNAEIRAMRPLLFLLSFILVSLASGAQKVERFEFNLYTDSLKKGFYNYINLDGQLADGSWRPLDSTQVALSTDAGHFRGNDLFIDSSYRCDSVIIHAVLRSNPAIRRKVTVYIRKRGFTEPLRSEQEILNVPAADDGRRRRGS
jgi:hypothetical protein